MFIVEKRENVDWGKLLQQDIEVDNQQFKSRDSDEVIVISQD